jgi:hypothetical protein
MQVLLDNPTALRSCDAPDLTAAALPELAAP